MNMIELVEAFKDQRIGKITNEQSSRSGRIFYKDHELYSFGRHYILARRREYNGREFYLINTDRYSQSTDRHMSATRRVLDNSMTLSISIQALYDIGCGGIETPITDCVSNEYDGIVKEILFDNRYYAGDGMAEGLHELPVDVEDIMEAKYMLAPTEILGGILIGEDTMRYRDWYFVESDNELKLKKKDFNKGFVVASGDREDITATRGIRTERRTFVFGTLRHLGRIVLKFEKNKIYEAIKNNAVQSFYY